FSNPIGVKPARPMDSTTDTSLKRHQQWKTADILLTITRYDEARQDTAANPRESVATSLEPSGGEDLQTSAGSNADAAQSFLLFLGSSNFYVYELNTSAVQPDRLEFTGDLHTSYVTS